MLPGEGSVRLDRVLGRQPSAGRCVPREEGKVHERTEGEFGLFLELHLC